MSKGSGRRRENTALVEANWPFPDRKADQAWVEAQRDENLQRSKSARLPAPSCADTSEQSEDAPGLA